jgi:hypothetical protein
MSQSREEACHMVLAQDDVLFLVGAPAALAKATRQFGHDI